MRQPNAHCAMKTVTLQYNLLCLECANKRPPILCMRGDQENVINVI